MDITRLNYILSLFIFSPLQPILLGIFMVTLLRISAAEKPEHNNFLLFPAMFCLLSSIIIGIINFFDIELINNRKTSSMLATILIPLITYISSLFIINYGYVNIIYSAINNRKIYKYIIFILSHFIILSGITWILFY